MSGARFAAISEERVRFQHTTRQSFAAGNGLDAATAAVTVWVVSVIHRRQCMARRRIVGALALAATVTITAAACGDDGDDAGDGGGKPVVTIGFQGPLSGDNAQLGINALNGAKTAVAEANEDADLPFTIELVESDDQG
nr:hypothetical protein [Micromonospora sp. DSM 115978]